MRVVVVHNRYQSAMPSGENRIVDSEIVLLREAGVEVIPFIEDSDELMGAPIGAAATAAIGPVVAPRAVNRLRRVLRTQRPDVVHLHNVFPLVSPWVVRTARAAGVPVVQTVHNYRHTCVAGTHLRDGRVCEDCRVHRLPWPAVQHACYRGSRAQSTAMAIGQVVHRPTWRLVSRFLAASPGMLERLTSIGIPANRVEWRPTFAEDVGVTPPPPGGGMAFLGRLEAAKGIDALLHAWTAPVAARWGRLVIGGSGPLQHLVEARAADDPTVEWRGALDSAAVREVLQGSRVVAVPSLWLEGFPRVAAEAMSAGRPLLVWDGGGMRRMADVGAAWLLDAAPEAWERQLLELDEVDLEVRARAARAFYDQHCSPMVSVRQLERAYDTVVRLRPAR